MRRGVFLSVASTDFSIWYGIPFRLVVAWGFGPTVGPKLFHPALPVPRLQFLHAMLFTAFVLLLLVQAAFVVSRRVAWHRRLGLLGWHSVC